MKKADHSGHRARMREKYLAQGLQPFAPHEVLEMLLFYAVPYRNTNDIAKNLIDRFGSLSAVFDATHDMLRDAGLTDTQIVFIKLIPDVTRLYYTEKYDKPWNIADIENLPRYIINRFIGDDTKEQVLLVLVDAKGKELFCGMVSDGDISASNISVRRIVQLALNYKANGAIVAHNHPSGRFIPSQADVTVTENLYNALKLIGVKLIDHYIVADNDCVSFRESGYFRQFGDFDRLV